MRTEVKDLLKPIQRKVELAPQESYPVAGVKWYAKGLFVKDTKKGSDIKSKYLYQVKKGDFLYNRLFAWKGSFALAKEDNIYASNEFPMFIIDDSKVLPEYLLYYFSKESIWEQINDASKGVSSVSRKRFKEAELMNMKIELPPIVAQTEIVQRISKVNNFTHELKEHDASLLNYLEQLLGQIFETLTNNVKFLKMSDVAPIIRRDVKIEAQRLYPEVGIRSFGKGTFHKPALTATEVGTKRLYQIHQADLLFSNVFAWEGAIAVAKHEDHGRYGSHRFISCLCKSGLAHPNFLQFYFLTEKGLREIQNASPGSAGRNKTLGLNKLGSIKVPVPDYNKQLYFVKLLEITNSIRDLAVHNQALYGEMSSQILNEKIL